MNPLYRASLALRTDLYQLTMACAYWKTGTHVKEAVFHMTFRHNPFKGGYAIACGLSSLIEFLKDFRFGEDDLHYLATLSGNDGRPLLEPRFLEYLATLRLECDIDAIPEGTVVFPHEPLVRVRGPIIACQLLETPLLNMINFQTLIATKAARIFGAARDEPVLEFGLRRAHGIDGAVTASRAAYVGGCAATSNVLAGKLHGIPVRGTHAHSWVMSFEDELESFEKYAEAMPNNCVFLVDTYDTLEGVRKAVIAGKKLRDRGFRMAGIRLDSGDLAYLSIEARKILDEGGFEDAVIVATNDLSEEIIATLKEQGAKIAVWGVGTRLATAYDQPALGGVYKLGAIRAPGEPWRYTLKLSEQNEKISNPGMLQVRRFENDKEVLMDMIYDEIQPPDEKPAIVDPADASRTKQLSGATRHRDLLRPIFRAGECVYETPSATEARACAIAELARFHGGVKRFLNPHQYPVGLEKSLHEMRTRLIRAARK